MSKLEIGVLVGLANEVENSLKLVGEVGLRSCQICSWDPDVWTDAVGVKGGVKPWQGAEQKRSAHA